jgi:hypothetical protein
VTGPIARVATGVDRVVAFLAPTGGAPFHHSVADCRRAVELAVAMIRRPIMMETAAAERKRLTKVVAKLRAARAALGDYDSALAAVLEGAVAKYRDAIEKLPKPKSKESRGGGPGGRLAAAQKRVAADRAFDLLLEHGSRGPPTLTKGGGYIELTNLLHRVATGKRSDLSRACLRYFADLRADGFADAAELRRMRRAGRSSTAPDRMR